MAARPLFGIVSFILLAGGILLQFLVILTGTTESSPLNQIYFLQSTTNGITNNPNPARWTFFAICGVVDGNNANCGPTQAALPFAPADNFGTTNNVPADFLGNSKYYYMSRTMFAFYLIALFFAVIALFMSGLALCTRLGAYLSGAMTAIALIMQIVASSLQTAWVVQGRNIFNASGQDASIGVKAMAFAWTIVACFLLATITFCLGGSVGRNASRNYNDKTDTNRASIGTFGRSKEGRSSFERSSRIKDDYS